MVSKPFTLFVLLATAGNRIFKAAAHRHHTTGVQELSPRSRLGDVAKMCVVPITSVIRGRIRGQPSAESPSPSSFELAKEACFVLVLTLLSYSFVKHVLPYLRQGPAGQPTKGACSVASSPQNGLDLSSSRGLLNLLSRPWQLGRRCIQRRRLYIHKVETLLEGIVPALCGSPSPLDSRKPRASAPGSHNLHDWHEALTAGFLMPTEVAACRSPPEVRVALQRLLADRWWDMEGGVEVLEAVLEDECLELPESSFGELS